MIIKIFLFIILSLYTLVNANQNNNHTESEQNLYDTLFNKTASIILENIEPSILKNQSYYNCLDPSLKADNLTFNDLIYLSGKALGDIGSEEECLFRKGTFILLNYVLNISDMLKGQETELDFMNFTSATTFDTGICIYQHCREFFNLTLNQSTSLANYLKDNYYLLNYSVYLNNDTKTNANNQDGPQLQYFYCFTIAFIIIRLVFSFIKIIFVSTLKIQEKGKVIDSSASVLKKEKEKEKEIEEKEIQNYQTTNYLFNSPNISVENKETFLDKDLINRNRHPLHRITNFCDFSYNLSYLSKINSRYYSDKGLEILSFYKFLIMILIIYNHVTYSSSAIAGNNFLEKSFYDSWLYGVVKFATFSSFAWIILESANSAYKLMHYIKKHMRKNNTNYLSFSSLCKYLLKLIPKIILVLIIYYFFYIYVDNIEEILKKPRSARFQRFLNTIHFNRGCKSKPHYIFIPFYFNYYDKTTSFSNCYRFINIYSNFLYCFVFVILLLYVCFKLRSKVFDIIVTILVFINICLTYFSCPDTLVPDMSNVTVRLIAGHSYSQKYTHLFLNYYMIGLFVGIVLFYHGDIISSDSIMLGNNYYPFSFCWELIALIDPLHSVIKVILFLIPSCLIIFISFAYVIVKSAINSKENNNNFYIENNSLFKFLYYYEYEIFAILFGFIVLMTLVVSKNNWFTKGNYFTIFNRTSTAFFCSLNSLIYVTISLFNVKIELKHQSLPFFVIGMLLLMSLSAIFFTIMYELPFRIWVTKLLQYLNNDKKNKKQQNESDSKEHLVEMSQENLSE